MISDSNFVNSILELVQIDERPDQDVFTFLKGLTDEAILDELDKCSFLVGDILEYQSRIKAEEI